MAVQYQPLSAKMIATKVSSKELSPQQALNLGQEAIAHYEADLNVFTHLPNPSFMPASQEDSSKNTANGPLSGISIGVKDIFDTHAMPTAYGSTIYKTHQPASDAALVSMLKNAGASIAGKTATTEFAWMSPAPTRNPHNLAHTPGGSSSGSAAGVAAGFFAAALGSQTGGSIIRPAAFCGVSGYKPSFRLFPTVGMKVFSWSLDTAGFFAKDVIDVAYVASACSNRDLHVDENDDKPPRIGLYRSSIDEQMSEEMAKALRIAQEVTIAHGATWVMVDEPKAIQAAHAAHAPIQDFEAALALADERQRFAHLLSPQLNDYLNKAHEIKPQTYDDARRTANHARKASRMLFDACDVLLAPSAPASAPNSLDSTGDSIFNRLWTLLGMPCVNVAALKASNHMPLGLQIIAPFGRDKRALQAAHWLENVLAHR